MAGNACPVAAVAWRASRLRPCLALALATAIVSAGRDDDLIPLLDACTAAGLDTSIRAWDDPSVTWSRYDAVLLRSTWDYTQRLPEFLHWCEHVSSQARLLNPLPVVRWNTDKHYLADLAAHGVPVIPSSFVEPEDEPLPALQAFLAAHADAAEFVVKPTVGAGSRDTQRYAREQEFAAANHIARLLDGGRSTLLQPYLASVDEAGETALVYFNDHYSHAIRKGPLLRRDDAATEALFATEAITPRTPGNDERALGDQVLAAAATQLGIGAPLPYTRVDLIRDADGRPRLLELELCEPSLPCAERFASLLANALQVPVTSP